MRTNISIRPLVKNIGITIYILIKKILYKIIRKRNIINKKYSLLILLHHTNKNHYTNKCPNLYFYMYYIMKVK